MESIYILMALLIALMALLIRKQAINDFKISYYEDKLKSMGELNYKVKNITLRQIMKL